MYGHLRINNCDSLNLDFIDGDFMNNLLNGFSDLGNFYFEKSQQLHGLSKYYLIFWNIIIFNW